MYFANEIRQLPRYGVLESTNLKPQEVKLAEQLIESLTEPFKPKQYHNEFQEKLKKLIEAKRHGKSVEIGEQQPKRAPVIDMMTALPTRRPYGPGSPELIPSRSRVPEGGV